MEVHDFARIGVAHPHVMNVVDRAECRKLRQGRANGFDAVGQSVTK